MFCYNNTSVCSGDVFLQHGATRLTYHNTPTTRRRVFRTRLCVFRTHTSVSKTRLQHAKFSSVHKSFKFRFLSFYFSDRKLGLFNSKQQMIYFCFIFLTFLSDERPLFQYNFFFSILF